MRLAALQGALSASRFAFGTSALVSVRPPSASEVDAHDSILDQQAIVEPDRRTADNHVQMHGALDSAAKEDVVA